MGRIPGFRDAIFPEESIVNLNLVANLGLVLYLFMIGLETDVRFLLRNWRVATTVAFAGLAVPFALGCAISWGLYRDFRNDAGVEHVNFPVYMLFVGVAIAITVSLCPIAALFLYRQSPTNILAFNRGLPRAVPYPDRVEAPGYARRCHHPRRWCSKRRRG